MPVVTRTFALLTAAATIGGCAATPASAAPAPAPNVITAAHVAKFRGASSPMISPDGKHIAFTLRVQRKPFVDDNGSAYTELHVVDLNGNVRPYITGKGSVGHVQWTPDGSGVSFLAKRGSDKHKALYVISLDGGEARKVASSETGISAYSWQPDGRRIAYVAKAKKDKDLEDLEKKGFKQEVVEEQFRLAQVWLVAPTPWAYAGTDEDAPKAKALESLTGHATSVSFAPAKVGGPPPQQGRDAVSQL